MKRARLLMPVLLAFFVVSTTACGGSDNGNNSTDTTNTVDQAGSDTTVELDEGGTTTGWAEIETIFSSCAGCHTGGSCTGGNCFLNDYASAMEAPKGPNCNGVATSIECGLTRAKDATMPLGGCASPPCIPDAETVETWIGEGMPE